MNLTNSLKIFVLMIGIILGSSTVLAESLIMAKGVDTVAGYSTILKAEGAKPYSSIIFIVRNPANEKLLLPSVTDAEGKAEITLYDFHTKKAGSYFVSAKDLSLEEEGFESEFIIYPDEISADKSLVSASKITALANGNDKILIGVSLQDKHGNPIKNHLLNLVSSRSDDEITRPDKGIALPSGFDSAFLVSSKNPGLSVYTAIDLSSGLTLTERIKIAYLSAPENTEKAKGASDFGFNSVLLAQTQTAPSAIDHFIFENIPERVNVNESFSFKVSAVDAKTQKVTNYTGKIRFTVTDPNATLPPDYAFKPEDLGSHEFGLGLRFVSAGSHKIGVIDTSNTAIKGEVNINVVGSGTNSAIPGQVPSTQKSASGRTIPIISSPKSGIYKQSSMIISGQAGVGDQLSLFDNDKKIGQFSADGTGKFNYQMKNLSSGKHLLRIGVSDGGETVLAYSQDLSIEIDNIAPTIDEIQILPKNTVAKNSSVLIKVYSEKNLSESAVILNNKIYEMQPSLTEQGAYQVSIQVPDTAGEYFIDVVLVDNLGNEGSYKKKASIKVIAGSLSVSEDSVEGNIPAKSPNIEDPVVAGSPTKVEKIEAFPSDSRVTLKWQAAKDNTFIQKYKVYYGIESNNLIVSINTFDAATTWYVPNLTNGQAYYFAVAGVDSEGNIGQKSQIISGIPKEGVPHYSAQNSAKAALESGVSAGGKTTPTSPKPKETPKKTDTPLKYEASSPATLETGPESFIILAFSFLFASLIVLIRPILARISAKGYYKIEK